MEYMLLIYHNEEEAAQRPEAEKQRIFQELITDGPFAETKEQLGGYVLVEAKDLDEAISIAARIPSSKYGSTEVRAVMKIDM